MPTPVTLAHCSGAARSLWKALTGLVRWDENLMAVLLLTMGCVLLSIVTPPLQSPDEHDHLERAYLLGKGVFVLESVKGVGSGGYIDSGLLDYCRRYNPLVQQTLSAEQVTAAKTIKWSGQRVYDMAPGTGYYFPAIYLPQALGLVIGEHFDLTVHDSYLLARAFALGAVAVILLVAFRLHAPNPLVLALISMPMTLFQASAATLDGISMAVAVFSISAFLRILAQKEEASRSLVWALALAIIVLASSRAHALPFLAFVAMVGFYSKRRVETFLVFALATVLVVGWTVFALHTTVDLRVTNNESSQNIITFYLRNPEQFFAVVYRTLADAKTRMDYLESFVGALGVSGEARFSARVYDYFIVMLLVFGALSITFRPLGQQLPPRLLLILVSIASTLLVFFALLVTWSPHPATSIAGIQGRYFLLPALALAYAISSGKPTVSPLGHRLAMLMLLFFFTTSMALTLQRLIKRYYSGGSILLW